VVAIAKNALKQISSSGAQRNDLSPRDQDSHVDDAQTPFERLSGPRLRRDDVVRMDSEGTINRRFDPLISDVQRLRTPPSKLISEGFRTAARENNNPATKGTHAQTDGSSHSEAAENGFAELGYYRELLMFVRIAIRNLPDGQHCSAEDVLEREILKHLEREALQKVSTLSELAGRRR